MERNFVVFLLLAFACSALAQTNFGRVKFIHAYPIGQPTVNISITQSSDTVKNYMNLAYKEATNWFYLPYDVYDIDISTVEGSVAQSSISISTMSLVIFLANANGLVISVYSDDLNAIDSGSSSLSFAHWINGVGALDIGFQTTNDLASGLPYSEIAGPVPVDAGTIDIGVRISGQTGPAQITISTTFESKKHYFVVGVGNSNNAPVPEFIVYEMTDYSISARLAFVHGLPSDQPLNVVINNQTTLFRNIKYKNITDYVNIPCGINVISADAESVMVSAFFNGFTEATLYLTFQGIGAKGILVIDDNRAPINDQARVRILHGASADPVDIFADDKLIVQNLHYSRASEYLSLPAATYAITVKSAVTTQSLLSINLPVTADHVITVGAFGSPLIGGIDAFTLLVVTDAIYGDNGNVRAVHAVDGGPNVNVKVNGNNTLVNNVAYKTVTDYVSVAPGLYAISVHNADEGDVEMFRSPVRVEGGGYCTAVAGGVESLALFQLRDDDTRPAPTTANLRVVHASASSPQVTVEFGGQTVGQLTYSEVLGYISVPAGSYIASVRANNDQIFNGSLTLDEDTVVSVFAVGKVGDSQNEFTVVSAIDFDYRTPLAPAAPVAPSAGPNVNAPNTPNSTPTRTSSASVVAAGMVLMGVAAII